MSPCWGQNPEPGKPASKEHCCSCNGLSITHHLPDRGFSFSAEHQDTWYPFLYKQELNTSGWLQQKMEWGSTKYLLYRKYAKLSPSAKHCFSFLAQAAAATSAHSGLPEDYRYHKPKQTTTTTKSRCPGSVHIHRVISIYQPRDGYKNLAAGWGGCALRFGCVGVGFPLPVISLNYRKNYQSSFLDTKLQESKSKRPFIASYFTSFMLFNTAARATQTVANQEGAIIISQKHLIFIWGRFKLG